MIFKYTYLWVKPDNSLTFAVMAPVYESQEEDTTLFIEEEVGRVVADSLAQAQALFNYALRQGRYPIGSQLVKFVNYQE